MGKQTPVALVVDDEPGVRQIVASMLRLYGFDILEAGSVQHALKVTSEHRGVIDLAVVNHVLQDGLGRQLADVLKEQRPEVQVLRYSGYPREELQRTGGIRDDSAFIQKPFRFDEFSAKVREVLGWLPERGSRPSGGK